MGIKAALIVAARFDADLVIRTQGTQENRFGNSSRLFNRQEDPAAGDIVRLAHRKSQKSGNNY